MNGVFTFLRSLIKAENISALVTYVSEEPSEEMGEKVRFKYPHIACEILTAEVFSITEKLCDNEVSISCYLYILYKCINLVLDIYNCTIHFAMLRDIFYQPL